MRKFCQNGGGITFDCGITASELIDEIRDEADIAIPIADIDYILWLNSVEQLLYGELVREQGKIELDGVFDGVIDIEGLDVPNGENTVRFEDIHAVYADGVQLIKTTLASGAIFLNSYFKADNGVGLNLSFKPEKIKIIYFVRPALKTEDNIDSEHVRMPREFVDLVKAKLRGEAYKLANEDGLAAKWLNDYNVLVETFGTWISGKQPNFGL